MRTIVWRSETHAFSFTELKGGNAKMILINENDGNKTESILHLSEEDCKGLEEILYDVGYNLRRKREELEEEAARKEASNG